MPTQEPTKTSGRRQTRARGRRLFASYRRVSVVGRREDDERLRSPEFQQELNDRCALEHDVDLRIYEAELDVSGSTKQRAILDSIIEAIEAGELDGIIVPKLDRLSRLAPKDRIEVVERIESAGGVILSASESFDARTPEGRFVRNLFFELARMEWEKYAANWDHAKRNAIADGRKPSSRRPFGYHFDKHNRLVVDEAEAAVVAALFELRAGGASWSELLEHYEAETGRRTARQTMSRLVRNRVYLGEAIYGELVQAGAHKPLVEVDRFDAVQRVNERRAGEHERGRGHAGAAVSELGGIARCHACGEPMRYHSRSHQRGRYECQSPASHCAARASIVAEELEAYVWDAVLEWAEEAADEPIEVELGREKVAERIVLEHRIAEARELAVAYESNVELELEIGREAYAAGRTARLELVERLEQELVELGEASELETVRTTLRTVRSADVLEAEDRRALLELVVDRLVVRRAPRRPLAERVDLTLEVAGAVAEPAREAEPELVEQAAA